MRTGSRAYAIAGGKGRSGRLKPDEQAELAAITLRGPDPEAEGISAYTLEDLAHLTQERFGKPFHPASMSRVVRRLGFSRQKARPSHPLNDPAEAEAFKRAPALLNKIQCTHKDKRMRLF